MFKVNSSRLFFYLIFCLVSTTAFAQKPGAYKCLEFDGTDDYVLISDHSSLNSDSTITVEAWIKADAYGRNVYDNSIFCKHGWSRGNLGYVLRCGSNGKISFNISDGSGTWREAASASIMETGIWYHVAGSFDGDSVNVYINGELVGTTLYTGYISPSSGLTARIGDLANGGGRLFDGMIDEVRVWSTAVDQATLRDWMCRKVNSAHPNVANLEGNWRLNEDSGTTTLDESGNSNSGTLTNGPTISLSGAVVGDTSAHVYGGSLVRLKTKYQDELILSSITGSPNTVHVVAEYSASGQGLSSGLSVELDSTHYFTMYHLPDTAVHFSVSYDFGNKSGVTGNQKCGIDLFKKTAGSSGKWVHAGATFHQKGDSLTLTNQDLSEYGIISYPTDSNNIVTSNSGAFVMCGSDKIDLIAIGNDSFTYNWFLNDSQLYGVTGNVLTVDSVAKYRVEITRNGSSCSFKSKTISVTRISKPKVTLSKFNGVCESIDSVTLSGGSPSGGVYSGTGVSDEFFLTSQVGSGNYTITYAYTDSNKCSNEASQNFQVFALPSLNSSGSLSYCNDLDSVKLDAVTPKGGIYSGPFISNNYFHIDSANRVNKLYAFRYTYTDGNNCSNSYDDSLEIKWATPCTLSSIAQLCYQDDSVKLKGSPTTGTFSGKGVNGSFFNPTVAGVGTHSIVYAFTNLLKCTTTDTQQVTVIANGSVAWPQQITTCINGDSVLLKEGTPSGGYFKGSGVSSSNHFIPELSNVGNHVLAYVTIDGNGCHNKAYQTAVVNDTSRITFTTPPSICLISDPLPLTFASPNGGSYSGQGVVADTLYPQVSGHGSIPIKYEYTNASNCTSTDYSTIEIYKPDSISISATDKLCTYDDPVVVKKYPSGGSLKGKGIIGNVFSPSVSGPGNYVITYSISGSQGCAAIDSVEISVGAKPDVQLSPMNSICAQDDVFELDNGTPKNGVYRVNGVVMDSLFPTKLGQGTMFIEYKVVTNLGCVDSVNTTLVINPNPNKPVISKTKNTLISSHLNGNQWYTTSGLIAGETNQSFDATGNGLYWTVVTSDSGCSSVSDTFDLVYVGISELLPDWLRISPNPSTSGVFQVESTNQIQEIRVLGMTGREVYKAGPNTLSHLIDLSQYPSGTYLLLITENNQQFAVRLMKE